MTFASVYHTATILVLCTGCVAIPMTPGERLIHDVHERFGRERFTSVTFVQATLSADGSEELWYEAIRPPGLVRVDITPLTDRKGFIYRADSMYVFEAGSVIRSKGDERWISMLLLVDIYAQSSERSVARLRELGVDLNVSHSATWRGRPVVVIGATNGDTLSAQACYDAEHLYPVRIIQPPSTAYPRIEFQIAGHQDLAGGGLKRRL